MNYFPGEMSLKKQNRAGRVFENGFSAGKSVVWYFLRLRTDDGLVFNLINVSTERERERCTTCFWRWRKHPTLFFFPASSSSSVFMYPRTFKKSLTHPSSILFRLQLGTFSLCISHTFLSGVLGILLSWKRHGKTSGNH